MNKPATLPSLPFCVEEPLSHTEQTAAICNTLARSLYETPLFLSRLVWFLLRALFLDAVEIDVVSRLQG